MKITKLAAIDIGSNAVRLLVSAIYEEEGRVTFNKTSLVRVPIRLGEDAFVRGEVSKENEKRLIQAMTAYKLLMDVHQVQGYCAFATSAMREVKNGKEIVQKIREKAGVNLEIIDGQKEGQIIFETELKEYINNKNAYLYIDVGGGSTELTILAHGKVLNTRSFNIGTVRWLNGKVDSSYLTREVKPWVMENCKNLGNIEMIGSGGNINHIFKYSGKKKSLSFTYLNQQRKILSALDFEDRLSIYNMKPDRGDVIIPALEIYTSVMKFAKAKKMYVPKIGLADGMVQYMYHHKKY
ncbi:exopolyphosphatase [Ornithobacterium rhinotracheale]|uniref:Exopolyphosphatase n=2 Tax=Ornithobacterium rhinotracheale TaxID=28251 RepID=A0A3R5X0W7_ORNRH|nr:exopolyphosphatase [Ornithobacterium rhinotracheale]